MGTNPTQNSDDSFLTKASSILDDSATTPQSPTRPPFEMEQSYTQKHVQFSAEKKDSMQNEIEGSLACTQCCNRAVSLSFCVACDAAFCDACWTSQVAYRPGSNKRDGDLH